MDVRLKEQEFLDIINNDAKLIGNELSRLYPSAEKTADAGLYEAEKYSLMAGGKRIRPIIALAFCRLFGGKTEAVLPFCLALEMVHTASLIHDDLPSVDNDDLRRGVPTNHKVFGEATALLAGDGLFIDAFSLIANNEAVPAEVRLSAVSAFAEAVGTRGLVGGEYIDVVSERKSISLDTLLEMHRKKTGALIRVSAILGALAAGVPLGDERMAHAIKYAENIGLVFQITDDILDKVGTSEKLGKNIGADEREGKVTFLSYFSVIDAVQYAERLSNEAKETVFGYCGSELLIWLAEYLVRREK